MNKAKLFVSNIEWYAKRQRHTLRLLALVASNSAHNSVLLASDTVDSALSVSFSLRGLILCLAGRVLLFARLLPRGGASHVADGLNDIALEGVVLAGGLAVGSDLRISVIRHFGTNIAYLGSPEKVLLAEEDIFVSCDVLLGVWIKMV